jgi:tetratricopeptide (TPR) repeat protein
MNPDRAESHVNLGALDAVLGRPEAADSAYARAIALRPGFDAAWIDLADLRREQGRELEAERTLREAIGRVPESGAVHHALGLSLARQRRGPEALAELAQASRLAPEEPRFAYVHAVALHDAGRAADARRELDRLLARFPGHREGMQAATAYALEAGDLAAARRWGERLARAAPWDAEARALVGRLAAGGS